MASRPYHSTVRQQQVAKTRERILKALAQQLAAGGLQELSLPEAAQQAGVSLRTLYRYFPTREVLMEALSEWGNTLLGEISPTISPDQLADAIEAIFVTFDEHQALLRAFLYSEAGRSLRSRSRQK